VAESKGLTVSPTDEHDATERDEPAETGAVAAEETEPNEHPEEPTEGTPEPTEPVSYRLRRAPRYRAFGLTGLVIGVILGAVLALSSPAAGDYSAQTILGYFVSIFGLLGALLGCGAAVLLDRRRD
jgi:anti-sigma factor RsiW